jgi:hypothetical protein
MIFGRIAKNHQAIKQRVRAGCSLIRRHPALAFSADRAGMDERFLVLLFKKEPYSLFEKREPKTFIHWLRSPVWPVSQHRG